MRPQYLLLLYVAVLLPHYRRIGAILRGRGFAPLGPVQPLNRWSSPDTTLAWSGDFAWPNNWVNATHPSGGAHQSVLPCVALWIHESNPTQMHRNPDEPVLQDPGKWLDRDKCVPVPGGSRAVVVVYPGCEATVTSSDGAMSVVVTAVRPQTFATGEHSGTYYVSAHPVNPKEQRIQNWYDIRGTPPHINPSQRFQYMLDSMPEDVTGFNGVYGTGLFVVHASLEPSFMMLFRPQRRAKMEAGIVTSRRTGHEKVLNFLLRAYYGPGPDPDAGTVGSRRQQAQNLMKQLDLAGFALVMKRNRKGSVVRLGLSFKSRGINCRGSGANGLADERMQRAITRKVESLFQGPVVRIEHPPVMC
ncbi:MAG: hypothetical protein AAF355_03635 [Myxococcota bacterium]